MNINDIEYKITDSPVDYDQALAFQEQRVAEIIAGQAGPCVWFLEHPPLYTAGTSARAEDLLDKEKLPVYMTGRGGEYTYHGPGQLVAYVMMDLKQLFAPKSPDLKAYIARLENWIIATLKEFGVKGFIQEGMIGVWVDQGSGFRIQDSESKQPAPESRIPNPDLGVAKISAIGVRVRKWVAYHGICINVHPNLEHYQGIVPCGISEYGVTSLEKLGIEATLDDLRKNLQQNIRMVF